MHAREENWAVAGIRSLLGLGHFMRDREITVFDTTCFRFLEIYGNSERTGIFLEIFFRGERSARRGLKVFEVSKFFCSDNFLGFFF